MMVELIKKLIRSENLTQDEASRAMTEIMTGQAGEIRTASFLTALAIKGETGKEIESFSRSMRKAAVSWPDNDSIDVCDTCGTGGDSSNTLNISTLAAIVLAASGLKVAKHGNRAVSSMTGSADLLEEVGIPMDLDHEQVVQCLKHVGITFLFAPAWHPAMKNAAPVRKSLGIRTVFNLLGPITNPAPISHQVVGVFDPDFISPLSEALAGLGRKGAYVIHSEDGLDEISLSAPTRFIRVIDGKVADTGTMAPEDFGFSRADITHLQVKDRAETVYRTKEILAGRGSVPENEIVAMNAALVYSLAKGESDLKMAAGECLEVIRTGKGESVLKEWSSFRFGSGSVISVGS